MKFPIGASVTTRGRAPGHTRLPAYLAHKRGVIVAYLGTAVLPDAYVRDPANPLRSELYTVAFDSRSVFADADAGTIRADLFADYFEEER